MQIQFYDDSHAFDVDVRPFLLANEAQHNVILGVLRRVVCERSVIAGRGKPLLCAVRDRGVLAGVAMQTPPYGLNLTRLPSDGVQTLAGALAERRTHLTGVGGPREASEAFAAAWSSLTGTTVTRANPLLLYKLGALRASATTSGSARSATMEDLDLSVAWSDAYVHELNMPPHLVREEMRERIEQGTVLMWIDGPPVAMASYRVVSPQAARINGVYVPPEHRRRGYASAVVHALSNRLLEDGRTNCFLFTDAEDAGPNIVYVRLGYVPIGEYADFRFGDTQPAS